MFRELGKVFYDKLKRLAVTLYGNFQNKDELKKFLLLAAIFGFTIGVYWILRPLKDTVFLGIIGGDYLPWAKLLSVFVCLPLVLFYSKLIDKFSRKNLFYVLSIGYGLLTLVFAYFIHHPDIGVYNTVESPYRLLGWLFYVFVESFGSIMVALFWSFAADTTTPESAKRGFPLVAMGAQAGGVIGPSVALFFVNIFGIPFITMLTAILTFGVGGMVWFFMRVVPKDQLEGFGKAKEATTKKKTGFWEGLRLMISESYLLGIFAVVAIYETIVTILDFQFKNMAKAAFPTSEMVAPFMLKYAIMTNLTAFVCILVGLNAVGRKIGIVATLLLTPVLVGIAVLTITGYPTLYVAFVIMIICKAINYALTQPAKEQLYIPTSKDAKYKTKAWIDMFGSRFSKGVLASSVTTLAKPLGATLFSVVSAVVSFGLIGVWSFAAIFIGKKNKEAIKEDKLVC